MVTAYYGHNGNAGAGVRDGAYYYDDEITRGNHFSYKSQSDGCQHKFHFFLCRNWKVGLTGLCSFIIYWTILYFEAASFNPGDRQFILTVGDTWRVHTPHNLWSRTSLSIQAFQASAATIASTTVGNDADTTSSLVAGLEVYEFLPIMDYSTPALCPPLTLGNDDPSLTANSKSPIVTLHEVDNTIHLQMNQCHYEYFHLNQGSILKISANLVPPQTIQKKKNHQSEHSTADLQGLGATNIYILQGYHSLQDLVAKPTCMDLTGLQNFRAKSVKKRYVANERTAELDYTVPASDYYIVVYDNAAPGQSTNLQVSLTVQMATHHLSDIARPICSTKDTLGSKGCTWVFTNDQDRQRVASTCIIAKAVSPQLTQVLQSQVASHTAQGDGSPPRTGPDADSDNSNSNYVLPNVDLSIQESQSVIVQVHAPFGSFRLIILTIAPIAVLLIFWFLENGQRSIQHLRHNRSTLGGQHDQQQPSIPIGKKHLLPTVHNEGTPLTATRDR
jgi:hypothetical protein